MHTVTMSPDGEMGLFSVDPPRDLGNGFVEDPLGRSVDGEQSTVARFVSVGFEV